MKLKFPTLFIVLLFFIQCKDDTGFIINKIPHLRASIQLPSSYVSIDKIKLNLKDSLFQKLTNRNKKQTILVDKSNHNNFILILPVTYQKIDSLSFYLLIDNQRKISSKKIAIDSIFFIGSKMDSIGKFKYIISKYQGIKKNNRDLIVKSVVVSSKTKTVGISFFSEKNQDIRPFLYTIKSYR